MKSQVAIEYLSIIVVGLVILIPVIGYLNEMYISYKDDNRISMARTTVTKLGDYANWVFSQGPPAKKTIEIYLPDGIEEISFSNNTINFRLKTLSGLTDVFYQTIAPINGNLPDSSGYYFVSLVAYDDYVNLTVV
jgi:uncharacterized protein (UPF0333 family)